MKKDIVIFLLCIFGLNTFDHIILEKSTYYHFWVWGSPEDYIRLKGRGSSQNHLGLKRGHC